MANTHTHIRNSSDQSQTKSHFALSLSTLLVICIILVATTCTRILISPYNLSHSFVAHHSQRRFFLCVAPCSVNQSSPIYIYRFFFFSILMNTTNIAIELILFFFFFSLFVKFWIQFLFYFLPTTLAILEIFKVYYHLHHCSIRMCSS